MGWGWVFGGAVVELSKEQIELMIRDELDKREAHLVHRTFCIERHKEVSTLADKIKSVDNRLWGIMVLAIVQLAGLVAILMGARV